MKSQVQQEYSLLIVDDECAIREGYVRLFSRVKEGRPKKILQADSGEHALAILVEEQVDCVLLDFQMPGGNGLIWLERIVEQQPHIAVIMLTGNGHEDVAVQAMKSGAMDYLVKGSFSINELINSITNALQKVDMARTIDEQRDELLQAERQRVVIESMAAACHHLGQPVTVLSGFLDLIDTEITDETTKTHLLECRNAVARIADILHKFQALHEYRTEPYLIRDAGAGGTRMLKIQ